MVALTGDTQVPFHKLDFVVVLMSIVRSTTLA